jgi:hypothetical protein
MIQDIILQRRDQPVKWPVVHVRAVQPVGYCLPLSRPRLCQVYSSPLPSSLIYPTC